MAEYIERGALMQFPIRRDHYDRENGNEHFINGIETVLEYAENLPAADVAPVQHGRWKYNTDFQVWNCSECGENPHKGTGVVVVEENLPAYCPHCGARMDGAE